VIVGLSLYVDENINPEVANQLRSRGIDAISVRDLGLLGDSDANHLQRASDMGRVLITQDRDFLVMASRNQSHAGIIFGTQQYAIGGWVRELELLCAILTAEDMRDCIEFV